MDVFGLILLIHLYHFNFFYKIPYEKRARLRPVFIVFMFFVGFLFLLKLRLRRIRVNLLLLRVPLSHPRT